MQNTLPEFKAILFDLGGVILNIDYHATVDAFRQLGKENFDQLYTQAHQDQIFDLYETGKLTSAEFRDYFRTHITSELTDEEIDSAWNALLLDLPEERITLLQNLKNKYPIYLFSNTNEIHYHEFRRRIEQQFGNADLLESIFIKTYYSHLVGVRKPNPEAFELVLAEQGLLPHDTLFIDDSIQHIQGAKALGIQTVHLVNADIVELFTS